MSAEESTEVKPLFYTIDQVCHLLTIGRSAVYDFHHMGILTIRKVGRKSYILRSDIDALLAKSEMPRDPQLVKNKRIKHRAFDPARLAARAAAAGASGEVA